MKQTRWFERKFDFSGQENILPAIIERLEGTPLRLSAKVRGLSNKQLEHKPGGKWSLKEQIGHLSDLEPLWMTRLEEMLAGVEVMKPADLSNQKTNEANHNDKSVAKLLRDFRNTRRKSVARLKQLKEEDAFRSSLHPRLQTPMRVMDLFQFVAEHDDHHLAMMTELLREK